jgi:hypothetical protein
MMKAPYSKILLVAFLALPFHTNAMEVVCNNDTPTTNQRVSYVDCFEKDKVMESLATSALVIIFNTKTSQAKKDNNLCIDAFELVYDIPDYAYTRQDGTHFISECNKELNQL